MPGLIPMFLPDYQSVEDGVRVRLHEIWGCRDYRQQKGLTVVEIMDAVHEGEIQGHVLSGRKPGNVRPGRRPRPRCAGQAGTSGGAGHLPDRNRELRRRDPAGSAWPRRPAPSPTPTARYRWVARAVPSPGRAREDWAITSDSAKRWVWAGPTSTRAKCLPR